MRAVVVIRLHSTIFACLLRCSYFDPRRSIYDLRYGFLKRIKDLRSSNLQANK